MVGLTADINRVKVVREVKVEVGPFDDDESVLPVGDVQVPGTVELQHAHLARHEVVAHQADHSLAVLDRPLDAGRDEAAQRKVTGVVAHPISDRSRLAMF